MNDQPVARRPRVPSGYGLSDQLPDPPPNFLELRRGLDRWRNAWLATTRPDRRPHSVPVWGCWRGEGLALAYWFSSDPRSVKGQNLAANPEAVVHSESGDSVVIAEGRVERLAADHPEMTDFLADYQRIYDVAFDPHEPDFGVYRLHPRRIHAWSEESFVDTAAVWEFASDGGGAQMQ